MQDQLLYLSHLTLVREGKVLSSLFFALLPEVTLDSAFRTWEEFGNTGKERQEIMYLCDCLCYQFMYCEHS